MRLKYCTKCSVLVSLSRFIKITILFFLWDYEIDFNQSEKSTIKRFIVIIYI